MPINSLRAPTTYITLAVLAAGELLAPAAVAAPNTFNTALPVPEGETIWREQAVYRKRSSGGPRNRDVNVTALVSILGYGFNSRLAIFAALPYFFDKDLDVTTPLTTTTGRINRDTHGFGDFSGFARYTVYQHDFTGGTFRIAPVAGFTAPTGDDHDTDRFGRLPRTLQSGDGAWDGFASVVTTYQTLQYELDAQVLYRGNGRHDGFARGNETRFDSSLQYRVWPLSLNNLSGTPGFVYALLESNLINRERNEAQNGRDTNSGGTQWLLAPGLQYIGRRWIFEGTVQLPVVSNPHGNALEDDAIVRVGFRRNF